MRLLSVPALLVVVGAASSASAQVVAVDPEPAPTTVAADPDPPPARAADVHSIPDRVTPTGPPVWYGDDLLIAGAVTSSVTMVGVSMLAASDGGELARAGATIAAIGFLGHTISGPALHGAEAGGWRPWVSLGYRLGLGFGIPGAAAGICGSRGGCDHAGAIIAGTFGAGLAIPVALDALIAWRPPNPAERDRDLAILPYATPTAQGATAGVVGQF